MSTLSFAKYSLLAAVKHLAYKTESYTACSDMRDFTRNTLRVLELEHEYTKDMDWLIERICILCVELDSIEEQSRKKNSLAAKI